MKTLEILKTALFFAMLAGMVVLTLLALVNYETLGRV